TGSASGLFVVDVDGPDGLQSLQLLTEERGALPETLCVLTGRGTHLYFLHPGSPVKTRAKVVNCIDVRGDGGYVVVPPSHHATGATYRWDNAATPIADAPDWFVDLICDGLTADSRTPVSAGDG